MVQMAMSMMLQVQGVRPIWWGRRPSSRWLQVGIMFLVGWFGGVVLWWWSWCFGSWCFGEVVVIEIFVSFGVPVIWEVVKRSTGVVQIEIKDKIDTRILDINKKN